MAENPRRDDGTPGRPRRHRLGPFHGTAVHIERTLGAGILVALPIGVTILILKFIFDLLEPLFQDTALRFLPGPTIPGLGVVSIILLIYLLGLFTAHVIGRRLIDVTHKVMEMTPVVKSIYGTTRSAVQMLSGSPDHGYTGVVLVKFPHEGARSIGLVTAKLRDTDGGELVAVYIPTTPIPSSGFLIMVRANEVTPTDLTVEEAMRVVISGGILADQVFHAGVTTLDNPRSNQ